MVNERGSPKTVDASSKLIPCLAKLASALFAAHSKLRAMIESLANNERVSLCKPPSRKSDLHFYAQVVNNGISMHRKPLTMHQLYTCSGGRVACRGYCSRWR